MGRKDRRKQLTAAVLAGMLLISTGMPQQTMASGITENGTELGQSATENETEMDQSATENETEMDQSAAVQTKDQLLDQTCDQEFVQSAEAEEESITSATSSQKIYFKDKNLYLKLKKDLDKKKLGYKDSGESEKGYALTFTNKQLAKIVELDLPSANITDITGLEKFTSLRSLDLSNNDDLDFEMLRSMTWLTSLGLRGCKLKNIEFLKDLKNLKKLELRANHDLREIGVLAELKSLTCLQIGWCDVSDYSILGGLTDLEELYVGGNHTDDISKFKNLTKLRVFESVGEGITDLSVFRNMKDLEELYLGETFPDTYLDGGNKITSLDPLKDLSKLRILTLDGCRMKKLDLSSYNWKNMEKLDLGGNDLTTVASITKERFPKLEELYLSDNALTDVSNLYEITTLKKLNLSVNKLTNKNLKGISNLKNLEYLWIGKNQSSVYSHYESYWEYSKETNDLTDFSEILKCNSITHLNVSGLGLTSIEDFYKMKNLEELDAKQNLLRDAATPPENVLVWISNQRAYCQVPSTDTVIDLKNYPFYYKALTEKNRYFYARSYSTKNCTLSADQRYITLDKECDSAYLRLDGGRVSYSEIRITVGPVDLSETKVTVSDCAYTGKSQKPEVKVTYQGSTLKEGTDYTLTYTDNKEVGRGTVTLHTVDKTRYTGTTKAKFYILPQKITKVEAKTTTNSVTLNWNAVHGATGYQIYQYNSKVKKWKKVATVEKTTVTLKKLQHGTTYKFKVRATVVISGRTKAGASSNVLTTSTRPAAPELSVKAVAKSKAGNNSSNTRKAKLSWKKIKGASEYRIYMSEKKDGTYKKVKTIQKGSTISYTKTGLTSGKTYYFKMKASRKVGDKYYTSAFSKIRRVKISK